MKKQLSIICFALALAVIMAGCGKSDAQSGQKVVAQTTGPQISGKILYNWTGFDEKKYGDKWGICIFEDGKAKPKLPNISYANWVDKKTALGFVTNDDRERKNNALQFIDVTSNSVTDSVSIPRGIGRYKLFSNGEKMLVHLQQAYGRKYTSNLAVLDLNTNELKKISKFPVGEDWSILGFDISTDESKIAYSYGRTNELQRQIKIVDINGNDIGEIPALRGMSPKWSPDGEKIIFTAPYHNDKSGLSDIEITLYDLETKETSRLTHHEGIASTPDFSPDGKQIVYVLWGDGGRANNLAVINIDGTGFQTLLPEDHIRQGKVSNPDWGE